LVSRPVPIEPVEEDEDELDKISSPSGDAESVVTH
jgi:hypothetical protein